MSGVVPSALASRTGLQGFKSLAQLGHLPKHDEVSAQAWLYGKLLVALLVAGTVHFPLGRRRTGQDSQPLA